MKVPGKTIGACLLGLMMAAAVAAQDKNNPPAGDDSLDFFNCTGTMMYLAQGPMGDGQMPPGPPMDAASFSEKRKHLEQLRMLKMLELLDLTKEQEVPFLTAFNAVRQQHDEIESRTREYVDQLAAGLEDSSLSDAQIYQLVDKVADGMRQQVKMIDEFMAKTKNILTAEQYGKLVIFHARFEVEMLEKLGRFREFRRKGQDMQGQGQGRGPRGGGK